MDKPYIKLGKFREQWAKEIFHQLSNDLVQKYLDIPFDTYSSFEHWIKSIEWLEWTNQAYLWIAFNQESRIIGGIMAHRLPEEENIMEMGTWIAKKYWGQGYNLMIKNEAVRSLFGMHGIHQIVLFVQRDNQRAISALKKIPYIKNSEGEESLNIQKYWEWKEYKLGIPLLLFTITKQDFLRC